MVTVDTKKLVSAIMGAEDFQLPDMNGGTSYLYEEIYKQLSSGSDVSLSEIDFSCFELDDIDSLRELHSDLNTNMDKAYCLAHALWNLPAVAAVSAFI